MNTQNLKTAGCKAAIREIIIGLAFAALGGLFTFLSYNNAHPGGRYTIYTGIIVLGGFYALHGIYRLIFPLGLRGNKGNINNVTYPAGYKADDSAQAEKQLETAKEAEVIEDPKKTK